MTARDQLIGRSYLLALDPGMDEVGYALFDVQDVRRALAYQDVDARFLAADTMHEPLRRGDTERSQVYRVHAYIRRLQDLLADPGRTLVLVERPATTAIYGYNRAKGATARNMAGPMSLQHFAAGSLTGALLTLSAGVLLVPPIKASRKSTVSLRDVTTLRSILPRLTRSSEHCRAACALAIRYLTDHRRHWAASLGA